MIARIVAGQILPLIQQIVAILKDAGIIKDPAQLAQLQQQVTEASAEADAAFASFVQSTQPVGQIVPGVPFVVNLLGALQNFIVALVRPAITAVAAYYIYPRLWSGQQIPPYAWIPIIFWFVGRSVEKILGTSGFPVSDFMSSPPLISSPAPAPARPSPAPPPPPTPPMSQPPTWDTPPGGDR